MRKTSAALIFLWWVSACAAAPSPALPRPLQIGWSLYPGWYPLLIAEKMNYFEKYGVDVQLNFYASYRETIPPLASGVIDAGALTLGDALLDEIAQDVKVALVTDRSNGADQFLAVAGVETAEDIRGKRIGVAPGASGRLLAREMLARFQLAPSDVRLVEVPPEQTPVALSQYIDIGYAFEPYASEARARGFRPIFTSAEAPGLLAKVFAFRRDVLAQRPQDVRNFIRAWFEAATYWQANPQEGSRVIAEATGMEEASVRFEGVEFLDRAANLAAFQPHSERDSLAYVVESDLKYLATIGLVSNPIAAQEILDDSYLR